MDHPSISTGNSMFTIFRAFSANSKTLKALQQLDADVGSIFATTIVQEKDIWGSFVAQVAQKKLKPIEAAAGYCVIYLLKNNGSNMNNKELKIKLSGTVAALWFSGEFSQQPFQVFVNDLKELGFD